MSREVVTSENLIQKLETGKVDTPKKDTESPEVKTHAEDAKAETKVEAKAEPEDDDKDLTERVRQKIGAKHRAMKEAEEFAEREYYQRRAAEKRAEELERRLQDIEQKSRPEPVKDEPPKQSDFQTVEEYVEALADYKLEQKARQRDEADKQRRAQEEARQIQNEFAKKLDAAQQKYPDFQEVTENASFDTPPHITQYLLETDNGAELGYHLSKMYRDDPKELNRILNLSPIRALRELGKLEDSFSKLAPKEQPKEIPASKAPAPITPALGNGSGVEKRPEDMNFQEYKAWKDSQRRAGKKV